jgi:glyoxylase-like metal-dependent hydrolase (beta-lactamase superfamily II)
MLVDPGCGYAEEQVIEGIRKAGHTLAEVAAALLTHCHVDHALGAHRFRQRGIRLVAAPRTAEILRVGGRQVWYEYPEEVVPTEVDLTPADGEVLRLAGMEITVLHTPGHTDGCASYLVETDEGLAAFTGDLVMGNGQPGWAGSEGFSVEATIASLEKLLARAPARAFTGHGAVPGSAEPWLRKALELGRSGRWELHRELHPQSPPPGKPPLMSAS